MPHRTNWKRLAREQGKRVIDLEQQRDALVKVADKLLADLEIGVEGLDPEEQAQVNEMHAVIDAARA